MAVGGPRSSCVRPGAHSARRLRSLAFLCSSDVAFDPQSGRIDFHRAFAPGTRCSCPQCGAEHPPVHDTLERDWRHLNCFQF